MKIAIVCSFGPSLVRFRGDLIRALCDGGHEVSAFSPPIGQDFVAEIHGLGADYHPIPLDRTALNPLRERKTFRSLKKLFSQIQPDIVFSYTAKPMIYASLAASAAKVPRIISLVTGLGFAFTSGGGKRMVLRKAQLWLYRRAFAKNARVVFQNPDDRELFIRWCVVSEEKTGLVPGSGVNLDEFPATPLPDSKPFEFLMVARLLREKGVEEFLEAARKVEKAHPGEARFKLVGGEDSNPGGLRLHDLRNDEAPVELLGHRENVAEWMQGCHCFVLPSYREGTPRSSLEALAVGRPLITTDAVGCRETVRSGENGWIVPARESDGLADAMMEAMKAPRSQLEGYGKASRRMAEEIFDVRKVNEKMMRYILGEDEV